MAVRARAAAVMAALDRRLPSPDDFAGQSWSSWVQSAAAPLAEGLDLDDCGKNGKRMDAMTLIKEDMSIFGHCPAHDDFYLVVCNHCGQVVKPQAFQKHCERRHGSLSKLYGRTLSSSRSQKHHTVNGQAVPGGTSKSSRDKSQSSRVKNHQEEKPETVPKDSMCLLMPVVNLEKIPSIPKSDGQGFKVNPKTAAAVPSPLCFKETPALKVTPPLKLTPTPSPKEPTVLLKAAVEAIVELPLPTKLVANASPALDLPSRKIESSPLPQEKDQKDANGVKNLSKPSKKVSPGKECDLNRQCGVQNPETKKICTRLLTCKIHSVHQRREVQGRAKDFDVLVAELKATAKTRESPKEKSPVQKDLGSDHQDATLLSPTATSLLIPSPNRGKPPTTPPSRGKPPTTPPNRGKPPTTPPSRGKPPTTPPSRGKLPTTPTSRGKLGITPTCRGKLSTISPCRTKPSSSSPGAVKPPHCPLPRSRLSSESEPEDIPPPFGNAEAGLYYPFSMARGNNRVSSEESEEEKPEDSERPDCPYAAHPPRPQAVCSFGSRTVSPGCYLFNRRLDRFCSALSSMLEKHLTSHMWKKIPPATDLPIPATEASPIQTSSAARPSPNSSAVLLGPSHGIPPRTASSSVTSATCTKEIRPHPSLGYAAASPHAAAACSQSDCTGGSSHSITSPLPANTPSPSFSRLPSNKSGRSPKVKEGSSQDAEALSRKRKLSSDPTHSPSSHKRNCILDLGKVKPSSIRASSSLSPAPSPSSYPSQTKPSSDSLVNGALSPGSKMKKVAHLDPRGPPHQQVKSLPLENRGSPLNSSKTLPPNCISEEEAKKRKNLATYCRSVKPKHPSPSDDSCTARRKKPGTSLGFEEKRNTLKSKAH
ncbi:ataxin-7-like protein 2 [Ambystoma mexicanum]|uniref:ataxin-7-like protein 2 n=1 Tax=Ambystoma mexicanum TaxID=8296 RepID=UPI0037E961B4